jgi:hypothetical protein
MDDVSYFHGKNLLYSYMGVGFAVGHHGMVQAYDDGSQFHGRFSLASGGIDSIAFLATPLVKQVELR